MKLRTLLSLCVLLVPAAAFAQAQNLIITFDAASNSVPVGGWSSLLIAVAVAALGAFIWRNKFSMHARAALLAIAAAAGIVAVTEVHEAVAVQQPGLSLVTSPASVAVIVNGNATVTNNSATTITLRSIALSPANGVYFLGGGTCTVGLALSPLATCTVTILSAP